MFKPDPQHRRNARLLKLATEQANASLPANHLNLTLAGRRYKGLAILIAHTFHWSLEAIGNIASDALIEANFYEVAKVLDDAVQSAIDGERIVTPDVIEGIIAENVALKEQVKTLEQKLHDQPIIKLREDFSIERQENCGDGDTSDLTDDMLWRVYGKLDYSDVIEQAAQWIDQINDPKTDVNQIVAPEPHDEWVSVDDIVDELRKARGVQP